MKKTIPIVLTKDEQERLLKVPNPRYPTGKRNQALLRLALDSGLRVSELVAVEWRDIDLMTGKLHVHQGKGDKDRVLWISELTLDTLKQLRENFPGNGHIFQTLNGGPLSPRYIQQAVARYAKRAGIDKRITPHTLRHTFATDLFAESKNIILVQQALGHSDVSTTMIYTHLVNGELEDAMKNFRNGGKG